MRRRASQVEVWFWSLVVVRHLGQLLRIWLVLALIMAPVSPARADLRTTPAWWDQNSVGATPDWHYRVAINVPAGATVNSTVKVDVDFQALLTTMGVTGTFDVNSPRVVRSTGALATTQEFTDSVFADATDATGNARGEVRFIFQHAEELSPGGAEEMVRQGVMDGVDQVIGLHVWSAMPVGRIGLIAGPAMAAPDTFECTIIGKGGHAAMPHGTIDPIAIGAQVVSALQHVVSRTVDPLDPVVVSVTQFMAGTTFNVIPNTAYLAGTVRTFDPTLRTTVPVTIERIITGVTSAFGATYEFRYEPGYRPVINDPALTARLTNVIVNTFGADTLIDMRPTMGGEDFSAYQQRAPGVFAFIGAGNVDVGIDFPHHHPRFQIDERSLDIGLRYLTAATLDLLGTA